MPVIRQTPQIRPSTFKPRDKGAAKRVAQTRRTSHRKAKPTDMAGRAWYRIEGPEVFWVGLAGIMLLIAYAMSLGKDGFH
jgi:hypothetical protein